MCRHQARLARLSRFPDPDLERTSWDVRAVEFDIDGVDAVLSGDEADGVLVWRKGQKDLVTSSPAL